jgi:5-methylcytosine-specific restriction endonuclease McrA
MRRDRFFVAAVAVLLALMCHGTSPRADQSPLQATTARSFVGAKACAACHQDMYDAWKGGRHSKMIQPAGAASVKANFSKGTVTLRGIRYRLRAENGEYFISESYLTGKEQEHRVEFTLGSRRIQHYLTTIENGKIIVLPPSWDVQRQQWFDNMEIVRPDENDQKPVQQWNKTCVGCHVSQQDDHYNPATHTYATAWADFGTSCERCHGPGSLHVQTYSRDKESRAVGGRSATRSAM